jgi:hypothetical protein
MTALGGLFALGALGAARQARFLTQVVPAGSQDVGRALDL